MNELERLAFDDDARFDKLVDGELSADQYREMLASLDEEPGGWRRCAMVFLEAQALSKELTAVRNDCDSRPIPPATKTSSNPLRWANRLAMAASLMVMFCFGVLYQRGLLEPDGPDANPIRNTVHRPEVGGALASKNGSPSENISPVQNLQLVVTDETGESRPIVVPLYDANRVGADFFANDLAGVPQSVLQAFRNRGFDVQRYQSYVPVDLDDGRQAVVPVDGYQFVPVGLKPY